MVPAMLNAPRADTFALLTPAVVRDGTFGLISFRGISAGNALPRSSKPGADLEPSVLLTERSNGSVIDHHFGLGSNPIHNVIYADGLRNVMYEEEQ